MTGLQLSVLFGLLAAIAAILWGIARGLDRLTALLEDWRHDDERDSDIQGQKETRRLLHHALVALKDGRIEPATWREPEPIDFAADIERMTRKRASADS